MSISIKTKEEIKTMREGGRILASVLYELEKEVEPGIRTSYLNALAEKLVLEAGAEPAFKGYQPGGSHKPYPNALCVSVNSGIIHGTEDRVLQEGDVLKMDLGVKYGGLYTDSAITVAVGKVSPEAEKLIKTTKDALNIGISKVRAGARIGEASSAIQEYVEGQGFTVITSLVGHGVGHEIHEEPNIPNYGKAGTGMSLRPGMTIAIEPMATLGGDDVVTHQDGWTIKSLDDSMTAHFEHTVLITDSGFEILTQL